MSKKQLLIVAFVWPEPNSTAAGSRILQLLHFFLEQAYQITIASTASPSERSMDLENLGITKVSIQLNDTSFDEFVTGLNPEIVLFDRFLTEEQFGWRVAEFAPSALRILDTEDLHSLRISRAKAFKKSIPFTTELWLQNDLTKREIASIYRCDLSLIISNYEMQLLGHVLKIDASLLLNIPFILQELTKKNIADWPSFEERKDFLCIGNGKHAPNVDAIVWLKKEIWPLVRAALPEVNLNIYGAYLPEHIKQMHNPKTGFLVHGWVKNKQDVFQNARVNLAPLRFGAGLKGKLIDAMQYGTPSITTSVGAEGMHASLAWNGEICDDSITFAKAVIRVYQHKEDWERYTENGIQIIHNIYNKKTLSELLRSKIELLQVGLSEHRRNNFIGAMLQHQTLASSKYMAKWIEAKNSK